jgi:hypothetical protein
MDLGISISNERAAILRFTRFPDFAHDRLLAAMQQLELRLEAAVLAQEPAAPKGTGELKRLTGGRVYDHGSRIAAVVGVRAETQHQAVKAAALEYGSHSTIAVKAHQMKLGHLWSRAMAPREVDVRTHFRTANLPALRFLRDPVAALQAEAAARLRAALDDAVRDASA